MWKEMWKHKKQNKHLHTSNVTVSLPIHEHQKFRTNIFTTSIALQVVVMNAVQEIPYFPHTLATSETTPKFPCQCKVLQLQLRAPHEPLPMQSGATATATASSARALRQGQLHTDHCNCELRTNLHQLKTARHWRTCTTSLACHARASNW